MAEAQLAGSLGPALTNAAWLSAARVVQIGLGFTVGVWVARSLGPEQFGTLGYAISFAGLFASLATLGLDTVVVRHLVASRAPSDESEVILSTAMALRGAAAVVTLAIVALGTLVARHDTEIRALVLIVASAALFQPLAVIDLYFQARVLSKYVVVAQLGALAAVAAVRVALILLHAPLYTFALATLAESSLALLGLVFVFRRRSGRRFRLRPSRAVAQRLMADAWPLAVTGVLTAIYLNVDRVLIRELLGEASTGKYAVVLNVSTALYFIPAVLAQSFFPSLVEKRRDAALYHRQLQRSIDVFFWASIAIALPIALLAEPLMQLLFGQAFAGTGAALSIHIWCLVVVALGIIASYWLVVEDLQKIYPIRILASVCTCVVLNLLLIPRWGIRGAAVATLVAQFVSSTVVFAFTAQTRLMPRMQLRALALPIRRWVNT
jgi:O-antigen/teichoic acid export membrane protein